VRHKFCRYAPVFWLIVAAVLILIAAWLFGVDEKFVLALLGTVISIIYSFQAQRREEVRLFKDLFTDFNERYDRLNDEMNKILRLPSNEALSNGHLDTLNDYFNLCGEEYLFYQLGYIRPKAWEAWLAGMRFYYADERIKKIWDRELESDSYYGFPVKLLRHKPTA